MNKTFLSALTAVLPMLLVPAVLYSTESNSLRLDMEDGVVAGWGNTDVRYPEELSRSGVSGQHESDFSLDDAFSLDKEISLKAWRGESVSAQIVVVTGAEGALDSLHAEVRDFPCGVRTGFVGYVMTDELNRDGSGGCGYRRNADFDSSYVADPIMIFIWTCGRIRMPWQGTMASSLSVRSTLTLCARQCSCMLMPAAR